VCGVIVRICFVNSTIPS